MAGWLIGLSLRFKLFAGAVFGVLLVVGYFYARWKIAASKAVSATARANALDATRELEKRIAAQRMQLSLRQRKLREELGQHTQRDYFDGGWGP